jgi:hypothetical protein
LYFRTETTFTAEVKHESKYERKANISHCQTQNYAVFSVPYFHKNDKNVAHQETKKPIPELCRWSFQSLPCIQQPALSSAGLRLLPGQFSVLQLAVMQSQT